MNILKNAGLMISIAAASFVTSLGFSDNNEKASAATLTSEIFQAGETTLTSRSYLDGRTDSGLKASFPRSGSELKVKESLAGDFSFSYAVVKNSSAMTVGEVELLLNEETTGEKISIIVAHNVDQYTISVEFQDEKAGIYRSNGAEKGLTPLYNDSGRYTEISGEVIEISYIADERSVYVSSDGSPAQLVWDLSTPENDGRNIGKVLSSFVKYTATVIANDVATAGGSLILYNINGISLAEYTVEETSSSIYAEIGEYGVAGRTYECPQGYASDILSGVQNTGLEIYFEGEMISSDCKRFIPKEVGDYTFLYYLETDNGRTEKAYSVTIYSNIPETHLYLDGEIPLNVSLGETRTIPQATITGGLSVYGSIPATVSIYRDGMELLAYSGVKSGFDFTFAKAGRYEIQYEYLGEQIENYIVEVNASNNFLQSNNLKSQYVVGESVVLTDVCGNIGGQTVKGTVSVRFPSGKLYANDNFVITDIGKYTVYCRVELDGNRYTLSKDFEVSPLAQDLFSTNESNLSISYGQSVFTQRDGVMLTAKTGGLLFEYKNVVNLNDYVNQSTKSGGVIVPSSTAKPLIELSIDPASAGTVAATGFTLYITDAYDPNNKITIIAEQAEGSTWAYIKSFAMGQTQTGIAFFAPGSDVYYEGQRGKISAGSIWGTPTYHSFAGKTANDFTAKDNKIAIYYDAEKKQLLIPPTSSGAHWVSADFDDSFFFSDLWSGFTSNEVYISGMITGVRASEANCFIYTIDGRSLEQKSFIYDEPPTIQIASDTSQLQSLKGASITLPTATASDKYGNIIKKITVKSFYKNGNSLVDAKVENNKLITEKTGEYLIRYYAVDCFGNVGSSDLTISVAETAAALTATLNSGYEDYLTYETGEYASVAPIELLSVENAVQSYEVSYKVLLGDEEIVVNDGTFYLKKYGKYTVVFTVIDYTGRIATASYEFSVAKPTERKLSGGIPVYTAFISENTYNIYDLYALDYDLSNGDTVKADVYINGSRYTNSTYTAERVVKTLTGYVAKTVKIEYKLGDEVIKEYQVPILPVFIEEELNRRGETYIETVFHVDEYFLESGDTTVVAGDSFTTITGSTGEATFAYPLINGDVTFAMDIAETKNPDFSPVSTNIKGIIITLRDSKNSYNYLEIELGNDKTDATNHYAVAYFDGQRGISDMSGSFVGVTKTTISVRYDEKKRALYDGNTGGILFYFTKNSNGDDFNGFEGDIYLTISVKSSNSAPAAVRLLSIAGQTFASMDETLVSPTVTINGSVGGSYGVGESIFIPTATGNDLLSDVTRLTVSVYNKATGEIVTSQGGVKLDKVSPDAVYEIVLNEVGDYYVEYEAVNARGVSATKGFDLKVSKPQKPVITLSDSLPEKVKSGTSLTIPEYTVSWQEESSNNISYALFITTTNGYQMLESGASVTFDKRGEYKIRFYALDSYGNYELKEYKIICE